MPGVANEMLLNPYIPRISWHFQNPRYNQPRKVFMCRWRIEVLVLEMVWVMLSGWLSSCIAVADDVASALRQQSVHVSL
uniref:Uncharacterized protein n=1 Tax=Leersia perrieri TaxID=77586 RepID=A0A0D9X2H1_9ORYZ